MDNFQVKLDIGFEELSSIQSKLSNVVKGLNGLADKKILLDIGFKNSDFTQQLNQLNSLVQKSGESFKNAFGSIDTNKLQQAVALTQKISSIQGLTAGTHNANMINTNGSDLINSEVSMQKIIQAYETLGYKVKILNEQGFVDDKNINKIREFTLELEKENGVLNKLTYSRKAALGEGGAETGFNLTSLKSTNNSAELIKNIQNEQKKANNERIADEKALQKELEKTISLMDQEIDKLEKASVLPKENIENLRNQLHNLSSKSDETEISGLYSQIDEQKNLQEGIQLYEQYEAEKTKIAQEETQKRLEIEANQYKGNAKESARTLSIGADVQKEKKAYQDLTDAANQYAQKTNIALDNLKTKYGKSVPTKELDELRTKLQGISNLSAGGKSIDSMEQLKKTIKETQIEYAKLDSNTRSNAGGLFGTLSHNLQSFAAFYVGIGGVMAVFNAIKGGISTVIELENSMISLGRVYDMTGEQAKSFQKSASEMAISLGDTSKNVIDTITQFKKLGYSIQEAQQLTQTTTKFNLAADINNIGEASTDLIAILKGYNLTAKDSVEVTDKINSVSNSFAVTSEDLANSLKKSSSALQLAGNDVSQSLSLTTTANEIIQDSGKVGNGLKTISINEKLVA